MKKEYNIKGMHCNGCKTRIENTLEDLSGITSIQIDLQNERAIIEMEEEISIEKLQASLPDSFTISE